MSQETKAGEEQAAGGGMLKIVIPIVAVLIAAGGGFAAYMFVVAPRLSGGAEQAEGAADESGHGAPAEASSGHGAPKEGEAAAAPVIKAIHFEQKYVNVIMPSPDMAASTFVFGVDIECNDAETAALIEANRARFEDMVIKMHDSRTRKELDDTLSLKESIQRQVKQKGNDMLARLQGEKPKENIKIVDVFHHIFAVQDN